MPTVGATQTFPGSIRDAESLWYDVERWGRWLPGLEAVEHVSGAWPGVGAVVRWRSVPAGRGRVVERVVEFEPLSGQTVEVEDDSMRGRQTVGFAPEGEDVAVEVSLSYELKQRSVLMALIDALSIRGSMRRALEQTLARFGAELEASRPTGVG
jgi:hypothetical protein